MSWIRLEDGYSDHDKIVDFAAIIGNPLAEAYLTRLWTWACRNRQSGDLSGMKPATLAHIVRFPGDPQELVDALHQCRLLDADWKIHNWHVYQGAIIEKREADRERSRAKWANRPKTPVSKESRETVARESRESRETVEGLSRATVRDGTVRDEKKEQVPVPPDGSTPAQVALIPEPPPVEKPKKPAAKAVKPPDDPQKRPDANAWTDAYKAGVPEADRVALTQAFWVQWSATRKAEGIDRMLRSLKAILAMPRDKFPRNASPLVWVTTGFANGITASSTAPNAPAASRGALDAHPIRYAEPAPLPGWTVETEIAACEAFSRDDRVRKFMVPRGEKLPDGFDVTTIPERFRPIRFQDEVKS